MTVGFQLISFPMHLEIVCPQRKKLGVCYKYKSREMHDVMAKSRTLMSDGLGCDTWTATQVLCTLVNFYKLWFPPTK